MMILEIFLWMIFAHFLGDFPLQDEYLVKTKGTSWYSLLAHSIIWAGAICIVLKFFGVLAWWMVPWLIVGHAVIDRWKAMANIRRPRVGASGRLFIDQVLHLMQLLVVVAFC